MLAGLVKVALGNLHSMVLYKDGSVWSTGATVGGPVGRFAQVFSSGVTAIAAGPGFSMVIKQDGSVWATGQNSNGQFGDGT